jgi:hypothetical protein
MEEPAVAARLSEVECIRILVIVQLNLLPDFIDVKSFFEVFALNRPEVFEVLVEPELQPVPESEHVEVQEKPAKKTHPSRSRGEIKAAAADAEPAPSEPAPE